MIAFNYDTLVEDALHDLAIPFNYGLLPEAASLEAGAKCLLADQANSLPILKLHGSMNWANPADNNERIRIYGSYDDIRGNNERVLLLPPTWRKAFTGHLKGGLEYRPKSFNGSNTNNYYRILDASDRYAF